MVGGGGGNDTISLADISYHGNIMQSVCQHILSKCLMQSTTNRLCAQVEGRVSVHAQEKLYVNRLVVVGGWRLQWDITFLASFTVPPLLTPFVSVFSPLAPLMFCSRINSSTNR